MMMMLCGIGGIVLETLVDLTEESLFTRQNHPVECVPAK